MPDDDRPLPLEVADDRKDIAHIGVDRVVLARAPTGFAEAALVEGGDFAVGGECFTDADPVVGVEVIGAVHEQDGRAPARAEGAVENRYVAGIHPSIALHDASPVRFEPCRARPCRAKPKTDAAVNGPRRRQISSPPRPSPGSSCPTIRATGPIYGYCPRRT